MRERARHSMVEQDRIARRYGLPLLRFAFFMLILSFLFTVTYFAILELIAAGVLSGPSNP